MRRRRLAKRAMGAERIIATIEQMGRKALVASADAKYSVCLKDRNLILQCGIE